MQSYTCINKIRDGSNNIRQYVLRDLSTGQTHTVDKDIVKAKLSNKEVAINNLKIDKQGRLVDSADSTPQTHTVNLNQTNPRDMSNRQLYEYIKTFENSSKSNDDKLLACIKEFYRRYMNTDTKVNQILQQLHDLEQSDSDSPALSNQIDNIQSYLLENANDLEQIKGSISDLSNQLRNLSGEESTEDKKILSEDGRFDMPDDPYSKYWYERYFKSVDASDIGYSNEAVLTELKEEMEKSYKAYVDTESFYLAQLADYSEKCKESQFFANMVGVLSDKFESFVGVTPDIIKEGTKELTYSMATLIPSVESEVRYKKAMNTFSDKEELSKGKANSIMNSVGGIWNNAIDFISNNPEWEIMLYVIQTMNHSNLHTFSVNSGIGYNTVKSEKGKMEKDIDNTLSNKNANALTEQALFKTYERFNDRSKVQDKQYECVKQFYDRFIVSYFAAKKVLYKHNLFPFNTMSTQATNGLLVKLLEIALKLSNVQQWMIDTEISEMCYSNNHKKNVKYHIDKSVKIEDYL